MKPEELLEELEDVFLDRSILWLSIEEAKYWGMNTVYYTLSVEPHFALGIAAFEIVISSEELTPIAVLLHIPHERTRELTLDKVSRAVMNVGGYIYGSGEEYGIMLPLNEYELRRVFAESIPRLSRELLGVKLRPRIDGFYLGYTRASG